ncbi:MAG: hypothetical protein GXO75_15665 [Calditrichaeota bacterium]|nr:hypothetical protein [Calditrichota bacterium]
MKDLISATSILFASVILVICIFQDVHFESALLRAGISFLCAYSIGFIALALFKVTIKTKKVESEKEEAHETIAQPENAAAKA